ncbi:unnamed protein product [Protopolystoma xenopodis]|uniref:Uncharacterized protein n=1 Tax=Protopolystoma xenopodis TaxID=117903 RepID=A0A448X851_9PLAT|nr:unnamed protein product [Protopolystoma xenopodis]
MEEKEDQRGGFNEECPSKENGGEPIGCTTIGDAAAAVYFGSPNSAKMTLVTTATKANFCRHKETTRTEVANEALWRPNSRNDGELPRSQMAPSTDTSSSDCFDKRRGQTFLSGRLASSPTRFPLPMMTRSDSDGSFTSFSEVPITPESNTHRDSCYEQTCMPYSTEKVTEALEKESIFERDSVSCRQVGNALLCCCIFHPI